jgi:hypothetical protein
MVIERGPWLEGLFSFPALCFHGYAFRAHLFLCGHAVYSRKSRTLKIVAFWASDPGFLDEIPG